MDFTKNIFLLALASFFVMFGCTFAPVHEEKLELPKEISALENIRASGKLSVITDYNSINYYIYKGEPVGYQYELLKAFAKYFNVSLQMKVENNFEKAKAALETGKVDVVALGMTVTGQRMKQFDFTDPIIISRQMLVQRLPKNWRQIHTRNEVEKGLVRNSLELAKKTIHVQEGSVFRKRLETLSNEIGDTIYIIDDERDMEELVEAVSKGKIDYTITDEHIAVSLIHNYNNIDIKTPVSFHQKIAWALRKETDNQLLFEINQWLAGYLATQEARQLYDKYFGAQVQNKLKSEYHSYTGGKLSPFDDEIKKVANEINWDWRLLASLIYQESEFQHEVSSWAGASGIMQLMPAVMEQYGIDMTNSPEQHIQVGGKYLQYLDLLIPETISDSLERIKFILAAYNAGVGHVLDARRLAVKYKKNPDLWTNNVDFFMRNKSRATFYNDPVVYYGYVRGEETFQFVERIMDRHEHYKNLIGIKK